MDLRIFLLLLVLQTNLTIQADVKITELSNPILPIKLGNSRLVYSRHTLLHYVDLEFISEQLKIIKDCFSIIQNQTIFRNNTDQISYSTLSKNLLERTKYLIQITSNKLQNLYPHIRKPRGLINLVGNAQKWLFGTLDSDDGQRYDEAISSLKNNQKNIAQELNLQISLSKGLIENYNKTIVALSNNQKQLLLSLKMLQISFDHNINKMQDFIGFLGILTQLNLDCQNLITFLDNLEDALMFSKLKTLHNSIISITELNEMLNYLRNLYDSSQIPNFQSLLSYYQFLGVQASIKNSKIIFAIHVPILRSEIGSFSHVYPILQNKSLSIPKYPYLAQMQSRRQYVTEACPAIEDIYYCKEEFHPHDECLDHLLNGTWFKNCPILNANIRESIIEQISDELVLILPTQPEKLTTKCSTDQYMEINRSVLVNIPKTCEIQINQKKFANDATLQHGKPLVLPKIELSHRNYTSILVTPNITKINFEEIFSLKDMANLLLPINQPSSIQHSNQGWIALGLCIIMAVLVLLTQRRRATEIGRRIFSKNNNNQRKSEEVDNSKISSIIFES